MKIADSSLVYPVFSRPIMSCHASTLCKTSDGDILAAFFGGTREKGSDVEIWLARYHDGLWSAPIMMSEKSDIPCWNPVLYRCGDNITLFFKRGREITEWRSYVRRSYDGGLSWSDESLLCGDEPDRGPVKNKPILLSNGTLIAGSSHESPDGSHWDAFTDISCDGGITWLRGNFIVTSPYAKIIQPTLWEDKSGVHMLLRSAEGHIYRADSDDFGVSWSKAYPTALPSNNSGIDLTALYDGRLVLCYNPVGSNWGRRSPLTLAVSEDGGLSWRDVMNIAEGEGEYSYPAIIFDGKALHVSFTYQRRSIMYMKIEI